MATHKFVEVSQNEWNHFDQAGKAVTGLQRRLVNRLSISRKTASKSKEKLLMLMELVDISMPIQGYGSKQMDSTEDGSWMYFDRDSRVKTSEETTSNGAQ